MKFCSWRCAWAYAGRWIWYQDEIDWWLTRYLDSWEQGHETHFSRREYGMTKKFAFAQDERCAKMHLFTHPETNIAPLEDGCWETAFRLGISIFRGYVGFGEGMSTSSENHILLKILSIRNRCLAQICGVIEKWHTHLDPFLRYSLFDSLFWRSYTYISTYIYIRIDIFYILP